MKEYVLERDFLKLPRYEISNTVVYATSKASE